MSFGIGATEYPEVLLHRLGGAAPDSIHAMGDAGILRRSLTALFCSERVAPDLVLPALDQMVLSREAGEPVISGFHSAVERECLRILLNGYQPAIACPARDLHTLRLPGEWRRPTEAGRLLLLSACRPDVKRPTARTADERNRLVAALASRVFIVGASPGGRLHRLAREIAARGQEMICFDHPANEDLILLGARPVALRGYRTQPAAAARASAAST
jgi:predicted Rossmann fold nucleotide-binding protein DprA/Smf involved in DNA uptake